MSDTMSIDEPLLVNILENLIKQYGLGPVLDIINPIVDILRLQDSTLPSPTFISKIEDAFTKLSSYPQIMQYIFYIKNVNKNNSKNSKVLLIGVKNNFKLQFIAKVQLDPKADSLSYEYYVGRMLNELRKVQINHFALVYGRFVCGYDSILFCNNNINNIQSHLIYECIVDKSNKISTLRAYIDTQMVTNHKKTEVAVLNILTILLITLQKGQDLLKFTHYDLHEDNILVLKLDNAYQLRYTYNDKVYKIVTDVIPFMIDYGRSHVSPYNISQTYIETGTQMTYDTFAELQTEVWKNKYFPLHETAEDGLNSYLTQLVKNVKSSRYLSTALRVTNLTKDYILRNFYLDESERVTYGIVPTQYNQTYDHYRLLRSVCMHMQSFNKTLDLWRGIDTELQQAFPFYIPYNFCLPTKYNSITNKFNKPIQMADYIYKYLKQPHSVFSIKLDTINFSQVGGKTENRRKPTLSKNMSFFDSIYRRIKASYRKHFSDSPFSEISVPTNNSPKTPLWVNEFPDPTD